MDRTLFSSSHLFHSFLFLVKQFRFTLLCHAACEAPLVLPLGGFTYGEKCLFIVNDWHAGLVPVYVICLPVIPFLRRSSICFISVHRMFSCIFSVYLFPSCIWVITVLSLAHGLKFYLIYEFITCSIIFFSAEFDPPVTLIFTWNTCYSLLSLET